MNTKRLRQQCACARDRVAEFFCKTDNEFICGGCYIQKHNSCQVHYIQQLSSDINEECDKCMEEALNQLIRRKTCRDQVLQEIQKIRRDINTYLDVKEREVVTMAKAMFEDDKVILEKITNTCEVIKSEAGQLWDASERMQNGDGARRPSLAEQVQERISGFHDQLNACKVQCKQFSSSQQPYTFIPEPKWRALTTSATELGVLEKYRVCFSNMRLAGLPGFSVTSNLDTDVPWISGMALVDKTKLLLVDTTNKVLKSVNTAGCITDGQLKLNSRPWGIATLGKNVAAITFPDHEEIQVIACTNSLLVTKKFRVRGKCFGIGYFKEKFVVSFSDPCKAEIINRNGEVLRTLTVDARGKDLFKSPEYVSITCHDGKTVILISDWKNSSITKLSEDGVVLSIVKDKISAPGGIAVSSFGEMFVSNHSKHCVHLVATDGKKVSKVLKKSNGLNTPYPVCFSAADSKLYVACCGKTTLNVFQLELSLNGSRNSASSSSSGSGPGNFSSQAGLGRL